MVVSEPSAGPDRHPDLLIVTVALQHFDLVTVGILDEEKPGEQFSIGRKLDGIGGVYAERSKARLLSGEIVDTHGNVTVTIAVSIGSILPLIERQFLFQVIFVVAQIHQFEILEIQPMGLLESECLFVERYGLVQVQNPVNGMYDFGHGMPFL